MYEITMAYLLQTKTHHSDGLTSNLLILELKSKKKSFEDSKVRQFGKVCSLSSHSQPRLPEHASPLCAVMLNSLDFLKLDLESRPLVRGVTKRYPVLLRL
jgi:hypothetical protein